MVEYSINPGDLRTRITFQRPTISKQTSGALKETWSNVPINPTAWAKWVYDHRDESVQSGAATAVERATVTTRYRSDLSSTWGVVSGGAFWRIISPPENVQNKNRWSVFRVERVKGAV